MNPSKITINIDPDAEGWETARAVLNGWTVEVLVTDRPAGQSTVTGWVDASRSGEVERSPLWAAAQTEDSALVLVDEDGYERLVRTSRILSLKVL